MSNYEPGKCNIGPEEERNRYLLGAAGFVTAGIFVTAEKIGAAAPQPDLILFLLLFIGFNGFIQGRLNFCAGYGLLSRQNASGEGPEKMSRDRRDILEALRIQLYSLLGALVTTVLVNAVLL